MYLLSEMSTKLPDGTCLLNKDVGTLQLQQTNVVFKPLITLTNSFSPLIIGDETKVALTSICLKQYDIY